MEDVYRRLAEHLQNLIMGYPFNEALIDLLQEMFDPVEAETALAIPNDLAPLEVVGRSAIAARSHLPESTVVEALSSMARKNLLFTAPTASGEPGCALLQIGYGMPQTFFWSGRQDETAQRMAKLVLKYFNVPTTREVYGGTPTKSFKYVPVGVAVEAPLQGVLPAEQMEPIIKGTEKIAVAHCPCRMSARILGRTDCRHSLEVCLKYDELAEFVISRGLAREISKDEARHILAEAEKEGLVHMVDNALGQVKHTCNCCGCYCWNVGIIKRRKVPRDVLMAVYFIRETDLGQCIGCGVCAEICPVGAVTIEDDQAQVDPDWCIGCGVCAGVCPSEAISIKRRVEETAPAGFQELHRRIKEERGLG